MLVLATSMLECLFDILDSYYDCPGTWFGTGIAINVDSHPEKNKEKGTGEYGCQHYFPVHRAPVSLPSTQMSLVRRDCRHAACLNSNSLSSEEI